MNAPAVFQRFMEQSFHDYRNHFVVPYLYDLLVFSSDFSSHLKHLQLPLQRLRKYGIKIIEKKYQLFRQQVRYLGRIAATDGYRLDPNSIKPVKDLLRQKPKILGSARRLLEMIGHFRKYIPNFSKIAEPLHVLLKRTYGQSNSSNCLISWGETQQEALDQLL